MRAEKVSRLILLQASATGKIAVDKLLLGKSTCTQLTADVDLHDGVLSLSEPQSAGAGRQGQRATGRRDFSVRPPAYSGSGSFDGVDLSADRRA